MDLDLEVLLNIRDLLEDPSPSSLKLVKLVANQRNVNKDNVNERNEEGHTLLHRVVQKPNKYSPAIVSFLLDEGALATMTTEDQSGNQDKTALHIATQNMTDYSLDIVKILTERNAAAVNAKDIGGNTPLDWVVLNKHKDVLEMICLLLKKGADINQKNEKGMTPLHQVVLN